MFLIYGYIAPLSPTTLLQYSGKLSSFRNCEKQGPSFIAIFSFISDFLSKSL